MTIYYPLIKFPIFIEIFVSRETLHVFEMLLSLFSLFVSRETSLIFCNYLFPDSLSLFHVKHFIYVKTTKYRKALVPTQDNLYLNIKIFKNTFLIVVIIALYVLDFLL